MRWYDDMRKTAVRPSTFIEKDGKRLKDIDETYIKLEQKILKMLEREWEKQRKK